MVGWVERRLLLMVGEVQFLLEKGVRSDFWEERGHIT
jgi:hypothetical protein